MKSRSIPKNAEVGLSFHVPLNWESRDITTVVGGASVVSKGWMGIASGAHTRDNVGTRPSSNSEEVQNYEMVSIIISAISSVGLFLCRNPDQQPAPTRA
jgi:hypothetical protein